MNHESDCQWPGGHWPRQLELSCGRGPGPIQVTGGAVRSRSPAVTDRDGVRIVTSSDRDRHRDCQGNGGRGYAPAIRN